MKLLSLLPLCSTLTIATSVPQLKQRDCNHDNCLRAMLQSASNFCTTYTAAPTPTSLPPWATACTAPSITSQILSGCACLPTPTHTSTTKPIPTLYLTGDSKMAPGGGGNGTEGWGQYLHYSFDPATLYINNSAVAGRSARSYTREGRFNTIANVVKPGDWVLIEFGTNDGGSPYPAASDNGRADCPGAGNQTCPTVYDNATEIVLTYPTYLINAATMFLKRGARVIIDSPTPNNPWEFGNYSYIPTIFASTYAELAVDELGGPANGVWYVQHSQYAAQAMHNLGSVFIDANYPLDHGHTAPPLAAIVAQTFVLGLKCGTAPLQDLAINATARIEGATLGTCILANSTIPI